jgi:hypothetical protein
MKKIAIYLTITLFALNMRGQSFSVTYTFDSVKTTSGKIDPTPVVNPAGVSFGSFASVGVTANPNASSRFSFTGWTTGALTGATAYASLSGVLDTTRYYQLTIAPMPGYLLDLKSIAFGVQRSGTGVRTYAIRSSCDGYKLNLPASVVLGDTNLSVMSGNVFFINKDLTTSLPGSTVTLSVAGFTGRSSAVTFRFYGYNAESASGTFSIDNVIITGMSKLATGVELNRMPTLLVYPNPSASGSFVVDLGDADKKTILTVCNIHSQLVFRSEITGSGKYALDLPNVPGGRYYLTLQTDAGTFSRAITISK